MTAVSRKYSSVFLFTLSAIAFLLYASFNFVDSPDEYTNDYDLVEKQRGVHVFGRIDSTNLNAFQDDNIEWITLVSWGFQKDVDSPEVSHGASDSNRVERHNMHWCESIERVRNAGFKVFFKPHLWVHEPTEGKWRSDIFPNTDEDWESWKSSYTDFILRYAKVAEDAGAEMYCLGTEFTRLTTEKPEYWRYLIQEVRKVYSGKLTYAANWYQEYERVIFWDDLDYIGIQAYFPLTKKQEPKVNDLVHGWSRSRSLRQ